MRNKRITRAVSVVMLLAMLVSMLPMTGMVGIVSAETAAATESTSPEPGPVEVTEPSVAEPVSEPQTEPPAEPFPEDPSDPEPEPETEVPQETNTGKETNPEPTGETRETEITEPVSPGTEKEDLATIQSGLIELVDGVYVPYYPSSSNTGGPSAGTLAVPSSSIVYRDIFGAHSSDMNGNYVKAGGAYTATTYGAGDTAWFPAASSSFSKELSYDGVHYVCIGAMYSNQGPYRYVCNSIAGAYTYLALPIRPSQEDGYDYSANAWTNYTTSSGVPTYKRENLKSKQIPAYSQTEFTTINLIYAVTNGMGGMKYSSSDANLTAAAYTLIMNTVFGYIRLGSDGLFHGLPIATSNTTVNQKMVEILVRCEVYTKEKGMTGSATGDNTVTRLKSKLSYTPTNMTDYCVASGTASYSSMQYMQLYKTQSSGNQIYIWAANSITFEKSKTVSLKKTTQGSASVLETIQNNPLYTLQGAVYEIHQGSVTGPVMETLTTNANGEASGTVKYDIGTTLYAVEITAPSGYLLNTTPVALTVSTGSNVFNVSDTPVFDPNLLRITKTGVASERIAGAVFKAEFYAWTWANPSRLLRTWYFQSDASGYIGFNDAHLATGYQSDPLFKPDGINPTFPLGCIVITEVKAANGYELPTGNTGAVFIFVKQSETDRTAYAYWGDGAANPLNTTNPKGIYKVENDADPAQLTAVNTEVYGAPFSLEKINLAGAPLEGAVFQVDYYDATWFDANKLERTWYFKTDSNGYFTLEAQYLADGYTSSELFPADAIPVGIMRVKEIVAPEGYQLASITGIWRIKQAESGSSTVNSYWAAGDGDTPTTSYGDAAYVLDAEPDKLYVKDAPIPGTMTMLKSLPEGVAGSKEGYAIRLYRFKDAAAGVSSATYCGKSDEDGNVYITDSSFNEPEGDKVYTFAGLVDGKYALRELLSLMETQDLKTQRVRITTSGGVTPAVDLIFQDSDLSWDANGDCTISNIVITGLNGGGTLTIEITNAPIDQTSTSGSLTIVKVDRSSRAPLEGAGFRLFDAEGNQIDEGYTDQDGSLTFNDLTIGEYAYQEFLAPEGFALDETLYPFSVTETNPDITIERENDISEGSIRVRKLNERGQPMAGVAYLLEYSLDDGSSWLPIGYRDYDDPVTVGCSTNDEAVNGVALTGTDGWVEFAGLAVNNQLCTIRYRMTEVKTWVGYDLLSSPVFDGYLTADQSEMEYAAVNHPSFQLPMTGGSGFTAAGVAFGLCILVAAFLLLSLQKKREEYIL